MNNEFPRMMYKAGGPDELHGGKFTTVIVEDESEQEAATADGFHLTTPDATEAAKEAVTGAGAGSVGGSTEAAPTRAELEQKAKELGIEFAPNIGDKKLAEKIDAKLKASA